MTIKEFFRTRNLWLAGTLTVTAVLTACGSSVSGLTADGPSLLQSQSSGKAWSYVGLIAHDNNLSTSTYTYVQDWTNGAKLPQVAPIAYVDDNGPDDSRRIANGQVESVPELDSASPTTVSNLLDFADQVNPEPPHRLLVLADHGGGIVRGICSDEHGNAAHIIKVADLGTALRAKPVDILYMDACFMQMVEVADQLKDGAQVMIGAESETYAGSARHRDFMSLLSNSPNGQSADLAGQIISAAAPVASQDSSLSAVRVAAVQELIAPMTKLSTDLLAAIKADPQMKATLRNALGKSQAFLQTTDPGLTLYNSYRDMGDTLAQIAAAAGGDLAAESQAIAAQIKNDVVIAHAEDQSFGRSSGLVVYAPVDGAVASNYLTCDFAQQTHWGDVLVALNSGGSWGNPVQPDRYPYSFPTKIRTH